MAGTALIDALAELAAIDAATDEEHLFLVTSRSPRTVSLHTSTSCVYATDGTEKVVGTFPAAEAAAAIGGYEHQTSCSGCHRRTSPDWVGEFIWLLECHMVHREARKLRLTAQRTPAALRLTYSPAVLLSFGTFEAFEKALREAPNVRQDASRAARQAWTTGKQEFATAFSFGAATKTLALDPERQAKKWAVVGKGENFVQPSTADGLIWAATFEAERLAETERWFMTEATWHENPTPGTTPRAVRARPGVSRNVLELALSAWDGRQVVDLDDLIDGVVNATR